MAKLQKEITVKNAQGLHARPAAMFVQVASKYQAQVTVIKGVERVNGKSIMGILMLGAQQNSKIFLEVEGEDAAQALAELEQLLAREEIQ